MPCLALSRRLALGAHVENGRRRTNSGSGGDGGGGVEVAVAGRQSFPLASSPRRNNRRGETRFLQSSAAVVGRTFFLYIALVLPRRLYIILRTIICSPVSSSLTKSFARSYFQTLFIHLNAI